MRFSYTFNASVTMYNRLFSRTQLQSKQLSVTFTKESDSAQTSVEIVEFADAAQKMLHKAILCHVNDPIMVDLLEPKSGNTVHNRLGELKATVIDNPVLLGNTVPPETKNGFKVLVFPTVDDVTLEGIAKYLKKETQMTTVVISDGTLSVEV